MFDNTEQDNTIDGQEPKKRKRVRITTETPRAPYRSSETSRPQPSFDANESTERRPYSPRENSYPKRNFDNRNEGGQRSYNQRSNNSYGQRPSYNNREDGGQRSYNNRDGQRSFGNNDRGNMRENNYHKGVQRSSNQNYQKPRFNKPNDPNKAKRLVKPIKFKENHDPSTEVRLNKYLANAGVCSRREADSFITAGSVKVNGEVIKELGYKITYADEVMFNDRVVSPESKVYVLLNKPKNCVTTSDDPENRTTVLDLVKNACSERIYPVGRLDRNTTGVLLLTNDGDLASKLMHPKFKKKKIYQVTLDRPVAVEDMQAIADGIELDDGEIHADSIAYVSEDKLDEVGIEIHSGRNRVVRRIFEKLNYRVLKLDRVYFSGLTKKNVPRGKWRYLSPEEVNILRMGSFE